MEAALKEVIRKRKQEKAAAGATMTTAAGGDKQRKDMLEELMDGGDEEEGMTEEETVDFLLALLVAGYETTSTIMTLAVKFLTDLPHALALLRVRSRLPHHQLILNTIINAVVISSSRRSRKGSGQRRETTRSSPCPGATTSLCPSLNAYVILLSSLSLSLSFQS